MTGSTQLEAVHPGFSENLIMLQFNSHAPPLFVFGILGVNGISGEGLAGEGQNLLPTAGKRYMFPALSSLWQQMQHTVDTEHVFGQ